MSTASRLMRRQARARRLRASEKAKRRRRQHGERLMKLMRRNIRRRRDPQAEEKARHKAIVNKMTNHERTLWARAGYPVKGKAFERYAAAAIRRLDGLFLDLADGKTKRKSDGKVVG